MLVVVDYGVGNLGSIRNMLSKSGIACLVSGKTEDVTAAEQLILPGVGAFDYCVEQLEKSGLKELIHERVTVQKTPVLGICVGFQMMAKSSEEGTRAGLGWLDGKVVRFREEKLAPGMKVPHMGWTEVTANAPSKLLESMEAEARFYFVHSYHVELATPAPVQLTAAYGYPITAGIEQGNIAGIQFHPEKSHRFGMTLLKNFVARFK